MQQRYYDPMIGRMLSRDPVTAYNSGDMRFFNNYAYAFNNPYAFKDLDGRCPVCVAPLVPPALVLLGKAAAYTGAVLTGLYIGDKVSDSIQRSESGDSEAGDSASDDGSSAGVVLGDKIRGQLGDRGWTEEGVREATSGEASGTTVDNTGGKVGSAGEPASVYGSPEGGYVVVNDGTKEVIQVAPSTETDPGWKPDPRIDWDKE